MSEGSTNYTDILETLTPEVRHKTIEIANTMLDMVGNDAERAVAIGKRQAERWAKEQEIEVLLDDGSDDTDDESAGDADDVAARGNDDSDGVQHVHVMPHKGAWKVIRESDGSGPTTVDERGEALELAQAKVEDSPAIVIVHDRSGKVAELLD